MIYKEIQDDLFNYYDEGYYVAQCLSADLIAGAGIAVAFNKRLNMKNKLKQRFPSGVYVQNMSDNNLLTYLFLPTSVLQDRVFNLITKEKVYEKPTYKNLTLALKVMKLQILNMNADENNDEKISKLALPLIGCGIDGLEWSKVRDIVINIFTGMDIEIVVCYLEKDKNKVLKNE